MLKNKFSARSIQYEYNIKTGMKEEFIKHYDKIFDKTHFYVWSISDLFDTTYSNIFWSKVPNL